MPAPFSKLYLSSLISSFGGYRLLPNAAGDISVTQTDIPSSTWVGGMNDLNGDGIGDFIIGAPGDDDKSLDAGRIFVRFGSAVGGTTSVINDAALDIVIDGVNAGDLSGVAVGSVHDLNGDGRSEMLVGAPMVENGAETDAGAAFVLWGQNVAGGIDLNDPLNGDGKGYAIKGEMALDHAGQTISSIGDLNGDGKEEILVGAVGNDAGGEDAGAGYVIWGKSTDSAVQLTNVAAGTGGFKIIGEGKHDGAGSAMASITDLNGDGKSEILIGASASEAGGKDSGAAYVVFGKGTTSAVQLADIADGIGGYRITGDVGEQIGSTLTSLGDVNGDGLADILVGAPGSGRAYVVYGKGDTNEVLLTDVAAGVGGYAIVAEDAGDLSNMSVAAGADLNQDGINDIVIGAAHNNEGGADAGAVYVVWGGSTGPIDLAAVAEGRGGVKIVGDAGSLTGSSVAITSDMNGDGVSDLIIGNAGVGAESVNIVYAPAEWGPDRNVYGTNGDDTMGDGYTSGMYTIGNGNDQIAALGGNDVIDGGLGADRMDGGAGDDTYYVDNVGDNVIEEDGNGTDTVISSINAVLANNVEVLELTGAARVGTGNALDNTIIGTSGDDTLDGAAGADMLAGGDGNDWYEVDNVNDVVSDGGVVGSSNDTIRASVDYMLAADIENLVMTGAARIGTGNALDNTITGTDGNDTIDGGIGADTMAGGLGDDTYYVDNVNDVIHELVGGGIDKVVTSIDNWTIADNIESVRLTGSAHTVTGNAANNTLSGGAGSDTLDGGLGDDTEIGGDGNDTLISRAGMDSLSGGSGDDRYVLSGGHATIEDFLGHDTVDATDASGDSYIDLSGDTVSHVENEDCHLGQGGSTFMPLDVQFLQDLSGSFGDDIANVRGLIPSIISTLQSVQPDSMFGSSTFVDKAVSPFGAPGEWVYNTLLSMTSNADALTSAYNNMVIQNGVDEPESQIEALMQLALRTSEVGFRPDSARFVVLFTDAPFHVAGDGVAGGITTPNNGDAIIDGGPGGTLEDYPAIAQLKAALDAANIIPIFAIANNYEANYQTLVDQLGRGTVVSLTADSSNVVGAITAGLTLATTTVIEDAIGGAGNDTLKGNAADNLLTGNMGDDILMGAAGKDKLVGGAGADTLNGGDGEDTADYSSSLAAITVDLQNGTASGGDATGDILTLIEDVIGSNLSAGRDTIYGNADANNIQGLAGNDILEGGAGADIIDGGAGWDTARYTRSTAGVTVNLTTNVNTGGDAAGDQLLNIEAVLGSGLADKITGAGSAETLNGANGNDVIEGAGGADVIDGGAGWDTARYSMSSAAVTINMLTNVNTGGDAAGDKLSNIEAILGSVFADKITGGLGAETLNGAGGNDVLDGGVGADTLDGGAGFDTASYAASNAAVIINMLTNVNTGGDAAGDKLSNIEAILGSIFADKITGSVANDTLNGNAGNDTLDGGAGADILDGGAGWDTASYAASLSGVQINLATNVNTGGDAAGDKLSNIEGIVGSNYADTMIGGAGADTFYGGGGADKLYAGAGADILTGAGGADTFFFNADSLNGRDTVRDFNLTQGDKINVHDVLSGFDPLTQSITDFVEMTTVGANTVMSVDRDGLGSAYTWTQVATLENITGLTDEQAMLTNGSLAA